MSFGPNQRMAAIAVAVAFFDQITKFVVLQYLHYAHEKVIIPGFSNLFTGEIREQPGVCSTVTTSCWPLFPW